MNDLSRKGIGIGRGAILIAAFISLFIIIKRPVVQMR